MGDEGVDGCPCHVAHLERSCDRLGNERLIDNWRKVDERNPVGGSRSNLIRRLNREPRLSTSTWTGERDESCVGDPRSHFGEFDLSSDETCALKSKTDRRCGPILTIVTDRFELQ